MPRRGRGGSRNGQTGRAYPQRRDLTAQKIQVAGGQEYGKRQEQEEAQRALPMAGAPAPPAPPAPSAGSGPLPGSFGPLTRPSERPGEPLTTGIPMGAGPGPEALSMSRFQANPDLEALAPYLPVLELMASQPNASPASRNLVRRLRGALGTAQINRAAAPTSAPPTTGP